MKYEEHDGKKKSKSLALKFIKLEKWVVKVVIRLEMKLVFQY